MKNKNSVNASRRNEQGQGPGLGLGSESQGQGQGLGVNGDSVYTYLGGDSVYVGSPVSIAGVMNNAGEVRGPGSREDINGGARDRNRAVNTTV